MAQAMINFRMDEELKKTGRIKMLTPHREVIWKQH